LISRVLVGIVRIFDRGGNQIPQKDYRRFLGFLRISSSSIDHLRGDIHLHGERRGWIWKDDSDEQYCAGVVGI